MSFNSPILFLIFNRPDTTARVFDTIRKIKPPKLFVAADGPRSDIESDKCRLTRKLVLENIDWECEVFTLLRDSNLGCGRAVSEAITWFFNHVDEGIIIEDDCLPSLSFYQFCEEMLVKYRTNNRIMIISGTNPVESKNKIEDSYFFTSKAGIWGWATWKRAWNVYDVNIPEWLDEGIKRQFRDSFYFDREYGELFEGLNLVTNRKIDTWDYQWAFYRVVNDGLGIVPNCNLISNLGFGLDSTHTEDSNSRLSNLPLDDLIFPLRHPKLILSNETYNKALNEFYFPQLERSPSWFLTMKNFIKKIEIWK